VDVDVEVDVEVEVEVEDDVDVVVVEVDVEVVEVSSDVEVGVEGWRVDEGSEALVEEAVGEFFKKFWLNMSSRIILLTFV